MSANESIKRLAKLISAISNGRFEDVEAESESFASGLTDSEELKELHQEVVALARKHLQAKEFILNLSGGNLDLEAPRGNRLVDPFKELQANMRHLVWQTREIAKGDYGQHIDFLGDFSDSFNSLVTALNEKKKVELDLQDSQTRMKTLVQTIPDLIWLKDENGVYLSCNNMFERFFGAPESEIVGKTDYDFVDRELADFFRENDRKAIQVGGPSSNEEWLNFADDGHRSLVEAIKTPMFDSDGALIGVLGIARDITERKNAEEAISISEARLKRAEIASGSGNWELNLDSQTVYTSEGARKVYGLNADQLDYSFIKSIPLPEYRPLLNEAMKKLVEENIPYDIEFKIKTADTGIIKDIHSIATFDKERRIVFGLIHDITDSKRVEEALKKSEEQYRLLHDSAGVGIGYYTPEGIVISYNKIAASNMNGSAEDFAGKSIYSLFQKEDADFYMDRIKKAMISESKQEYEEKVELPTGVKWFHSVYTKILDSSNQVVGVQIISTDITEQKRAVELLKESEAKFRDLFTQMNEGFALHQVIYDANHMATDYTILDVNPAFEKQVGITIEKAKGALATELYGVTPAPFLDIYAQVAETGKNQSFQTYFPPLDRHFQISVFSHNSGFFATVFTDITERVKRDEALSNINDLLSKFILHSPIYTFIKEVTPNESRVLKASENFIDMIGIPGSQMVGKTMHELFPPEFASKITTDDWEVASNDHLIHLDEELSGRHYFTIKYPIKQGNKTLLAGYTIDITERKNAENALRESEERFRTLANSGQALIWTSGLDKKCNYFNQPWLDFTGRTIEQELGDGWIEGVHPDDLQHCVETYMTAFDRQEKFSMEYRVRHVTGDYRWIQDDGSPRFDSKGEFIGFIGHCLDITERKQVEAISKENEIRLCELNATKDKFFSIISHDLKNPFNSILGLSNLLVEQIREKNLDGIEEYAAIIQKSSMQVFDLLVNLLEWSRSQTGRMEFSPEYIEMVALTNEVTELLSDSAKQKSITIFKELPRNMLIYADKAMISTVLRNIISNAIKFTYPNGQINISAQSVEEGWIFAVKDNGVGMKNKNVEKLFSIAENQTTLGTKNERGTGLGLILCKEFIEKHDGKIWVESEVGKGSTFYFTLPVFLEPYSS